MNIGYIYNLQAYPPKGGNDVHVNEMINGFINTGNSVFVVDDTSMPNVRNYSSKNKSGINEFISKIDILYVRIDGRCVRKWKTIFKCMRLCITIPVIWEINAPANEALAFSWLGGANNNTEQESTFRTLRRWLHALRKLPSIYLEERARKQLAQNVAATICVSSSLGNYASEGLKINKLLILPNAGHPLSEEEINHHRRNSIENKFQVLYIGSAIYPWQGLNYLSRTIELADKQNQNIQFVLAVNQITKNLPSSKNVEIIQGLNREEITKQICVSDICVALHPEYFWSKWKFHGSPMKLFEYMSCMRPVITSNLGQMQEIINDHVDGVLCENTPQDILKKILYLKEHNQEAGEIARKGWERTKSEFNWESNTQKTLDFFREIIIYKQSQD